MTPASLAWYRTEWRAAFGDSVPKRGLDELARLSYENERLRQRLATVEALLYQMAMRCDGRGE